jgi:hypothetical protein
MAIMPVCSVCNHNSHVTCSVDPVVVATRIALQATMGILAWPFKAGLPPLASTYFCSRDVHKWTEAIRRS